MNKLSHAVVQSCSHAFFITNVGNRTDKALPFLYNVFQTEHRIPFTVLHC
jgi:hypothetical protein